MMMFVCPSSSAPPLTLGLGVFLFTSQPPPLIGWHRNTNSGSCFHSIKETIGVFINKPNTKHFQLG